MVGQKFVELLANHPWFEIVALGASEKSVGKEYADIVNWKMCSPLPQSLSKLILQPCLPNFPCSLIFSSLSSDNAGSIEDSFAKEGYLVISNSASHRMSPNVPLMIPEVNSNHLDLLNYQRSKGKIITNPNCSVIALAMALKPLIDLWGIEQCLVVTLQAISGAGYPGVSAYDIIDNVIPYIDQEEEKVEQEMLKILGSLENGAIKKYPMRVSAQCNRVPVVDGHMACISVKLKKKAHSDRIIRSWKDFSKNQKEQDLPTAPLESIIYHDAKNYPQPKLHKNLNKGMSVSIGGLRECAVLDWKFNILSHNTVRGAAGGSLLIAELMKKKGLI